MKNTEGQPGQSSHSEKLRDAAEAKLDRSSGGYDPMKAKSPEELVHELQVHQIELEMQNEELRRSQLALEESRDKYRELYDFAPVGYFTFTHKGVILAVNLTGAEFLRCERRRLIEQAFGQFVTEKDLDQWDRHLRDAIKTNRMLRCELTLKRGDGSILEARLDSIQRERGGGRFSPGAHYYDRYHGTPEDGGGTP